LKSKESGGCLKGGAKFVASATSAARVLASKKPYLMYGTAWKKDNTANLVTEAIRSGFRFIDTACQPKHYNEPGVGEGIAAAMIELNLSRGDLYIQTKFTSFDGQDPERVPYDREADLEEQVMQSFETSLRNLKTTYLDSLVMHSPMRKREETMRVWRVFEKLVDEGKVLNLGISNCYDYHQFRFIFDHARIKPKHIQNRFYGDSGFDTQIREFCAENECLYQSFWTLTGNRRALHSSEVRHLAEAKGLTPQTLMYAFMMTLGHTPLDGTTNKQHMMEDVAIMERIQNGEVILNDDEMSDMASFLGVDLHTDED